jgi:uncharacterized flavoprotein (TIGR03862 family)
MKQRIAIVGAGPAALCLAAHLDPVKWEIHIYEKKSAPARKFLVAGKGGFNLTHAEPSEQFIQRYHPSTFIAPFFNAFSNTDLRNWLHDIGIPTYVGTSNRVFPERGIKPIEVLEAILKVIQKNGVQLHLRHEWKGWTNHTLHFHTPDGDRYVEPSVTVFALGGGSWGITGSDGNWQALFLEKGLRVRPFESSNCAMQVQWPTQLRKEAEGLPLKNIIASCDGMEKKGEALITSTGLEGSAIYYLAPAVRAALSAKGEALLLLDLKPDKTAEEIATLLHDAAAKKTIKDLLETKLKLSQAAIGLLRHCLPKEAYQDKNMLTSKIKKFPVTIHALSPIEEAISTVGGITLEEVDQHLQLSKFKGNYVMGEMLDWDAPTGGYLLQACFSMGYYLAKHLNGLSA